MTVDIPDSVESLGYSVFSGCTGITEVSIGGGLTSVYSGVFSGCTLIDTVSIARGTTVIGSDMFSGCTSLKSVTMPNTIETIGESAFNSCTSLTSITIPDSVTSIGNSAFYNCKSIESLKIGANVRSIGGYAFQNCTKLPSITIPQSVESMGYDTFKGCTGITMATINGKLTSISDGTFQNCTSLTTVKIADGTTLIGSSMFYGCTALKSVTMPDSVVTIGGSAFYGCQSLTSLRMSANVTSIGGSAFFNCKGITSVSLPEIESIGSYAYEGCSSLKTVSLGGYLDKMGYSAFEDCTSLTTVNFAQGATIIGNSAFYNCTALKTVTIPHPFLQIGSVELNDDNLKDNNVFYNHPADMVIYGKSGSFAEQFAVANGIKFSTNAVKVNVSQCNITLGATTNYFRGTRVKPVVTVKYGGKTLKAGTDYSTSYTNNLSVGTASVKITGKGAYTGTVTKTYKIIARSIANCDIQLSSTSYYFNGTRIKPTVKVYCNGTELYSGNYVATYSENLSAGTAKITLTGKNNLTGTAVRTFKINPRNIANCTVTLTKNSSNKYQPKVTVKIGSTALYNGNYTVSYKTSADKKTVTVKLTGKNNLAGSVTKTYKVV